MKLDEEIKKNLKEGKVIIGFKESLKYLKRNKAKMVIIANNIPEEMRKKLEISADNIKIFNGSSKELGTLCGRPHPVSTIVIKG